MKWCCPGPCQQANTRWRSTLVCSPPGGRVPWERSQQSECPLPPRAGTPSVLPDLPHAPPLHTAVPRDGTAILSHRGSLKIK